MPDPTPTPASPGTLADKIALLNVAAVLAAGEAEGLADTLKTDPDTVDPETANRTAMIFRLLRTHYNFLVQSLANPVYFPEAPAGCAGLVTAPTFPTVLPPVLPK